MSKIIISLFAISQVFSFITLFQVGPSEIWSQVQHHDFYFEFISHFVTSSTEPHTYLQTLCVLLFYSLPFSYHYIINSTTTTQNTEIEILTIHDFMCVEKDNANFPHFLSDLLQF